MMDKRTEVDMDKVNASLDVVSSITGIDRNMLCTTDRHKRYAIARFMAYYVLRYHCGLSYYRISKLMNRTHAAVIHGITVAEQWDESNRFRDKFAKKHGETLTNIMNLLKENNAHLQSDNQGSRV